MKKKIADKWVEALRSGKYQQGRFRLNEDGNFCCLGVLCEIAVEEGIAKKFISTDRKGTRIYGYSSGDDGFPEYTAPDSEIMKWSGLKTNSGSVMTSDGAMSLVSLNDNRGYSFSQIADFIEKNYKKL